MTRAFRGILSVALLAALALGPAGCASMPPGTPVTIPVLAAPPPMTGDLTADSAGGGWGGTLRLDLSPNTYVLLGRATDPANGADFVYVGISCSDFAPSPATRVVLGVVTKLTPFPTCAWKAHLTPIPPGTNAAIPGDEFWRNHTTWNNPGGSVVQPPGIGWPFPNTFSWMQGGGSNLWTLETKIYCNPANNNNGVWFPAAGTPFSLYLNVLNNGNAGAPGNMQFPWPATTTILGDIKTHTPALGLWGQALF